MTQKAPHVAASTTAERWWGKIPSREASQFRRRSSPFGGITLATGRWRAVATRDGQETSNEIIRWGVAAPTSRVKRILSWLRHEALGILGLVLAIVGVASAVWIAYGQNRLDRDLARAVDTLCR